ncbi:mpv17-like protein isoform X2 [Anticarsia gemmatalis]
MVTLLKEMFRRSLKKHPVLTNTAVYASFYTAAELSQQTFNRHYTPEKPEYNYAAAARIASVGSTVYAPALYFWYRYLDKRFSGTAVKMVMTKVAADQFIMTPILLAAFYTVMAVVERKEDVFEELREKYWKTFIANQSFWIPGQTINFFFIPSHLRVVYVASVSFLWINVLCYIKRQKLEKTELSK